MFRSGLKTVLAVVGWIIAIPSAIVGTCCACYLLLLAIWAIFALIDFVADRPVIWVGAGALVGLSLLGHCYFRRRKKRGFDQ